jgi:hypothetical protein
MSHTWPVGTVFDEVDLFLHGQGCDYCRTELHTWGHRPRRVFTLGGPQLLIVRVGHCPTAVGEVVAGQEPLVSPPSAAGQVVLDYCAAVRGILNDDQGGPLHPPGLRMADALQEVRQSLHRCTKMKEKDAPRKRSSG